MMLVWCEKGLHHYDASEEAEDCNGIGSRHQIVRQSSITSHRINTALANTPVRPRSPRKTGKRRVKRR